MLVAGLGFAVMGAFVKTGAQHFSSTELVFYRSLFGFVAIAVMVFWQGKSLRTPLFAKQMSRALIGFIALLLFFYAIANLPLATAITLNYTSPMFLALLTPWLLSSERLFSRWQQTVLNICVVTGFIGVTFLLQPRWEADSWLAGGLGLLSGLGAALAYVHVKQLGMHGEPDWRTVFYFTLVCSVASGGLMLNTHTTPVYWDDLPLLLGLGVSATVSQLAMTRAYRTGQTLTVASLAYSTVVFATLIGVFWWDEHLSWMEYLGMLLIMLSGIASSRASRS